MEQKPYPPIAPGTKVKTTQEDPTAASQYIEGARTNCQWGVEGTVVTHHDSHGLCYDVRHADGTEQTYEPTELEVLN